MTLHSFKLKSDKNKMIREIFAQFNKILTKRVVSSRHLYEVPVKLTFESNDTTGKLKLPKISLYVTGETKDLSETGIAFVVSSIRVQENYLVGEERLLNAELDLPGGKLKMRIVGRRYEQLGDSVANGKFLIGAKIVQMTDENREFYHNFLINGNKALERKVLSFGVGQR